MPESPHLVWKDITLYPCDVAKLEDGEWLTDSLIEWHYEWLENAVGGSSSTILFLRPLMVTMLAQYEGDVWDLQPVFPPRLDTREIVFMPINNGSGLTGGGTHWSMVMYHAPSKIFYCFDSMGRMNQSAAEHAMEKLTALLRVSSPACEHVTITKQANSSDCGVYVCAISEFITLEHFMPNATDLSDPAVVREAVDAVRKKWWDAAYMSEMRAKLRRLIDELREGGHMDNER
ncbi:hypothetical protein DFJ77DRAFT_457055 [Powellomyces hirtus]|nr:hypothetical protein DFJ77DRAFT_457055 [Powellomyces hirtus]